MIVEKALNSFKKQPKHRCFFMEEVVTTKHGVYVQGDLHVTVEKYNREFYAQLSIGLDIYPDQTVKLRKSKHELFCLEIIRGDKKHRVRANPDQLRKLAVQQMKRYLDEEGVKDTVLVQLRDIGVI